MTCASIWIYIYIYIYIGTQVSMHARIERTYQALHICRGVCVESDVLSFDFLFTRSARAQFYCFSLEDESFSLCTWLGVTGAEVCLVMFCREKYSRSIDTALRAAHVAATCLSTAFPLRVFGFQAGKLSRSKTLMLTKVRSTVSCRESTRCTWLYIGGLLQVDRGTDLDVDVD